MKVFISTIVFAILLGSIVLYNGCSETPINPSGEQITNTDGMNVLPNYFYGLGTGYPKKCGVNTRLELWAGAGKPEAATLVGYVEFVSTGPNSLLVRYLFNDVDQNGQNDMFPWVVKEIHFDIGNSLQDIPVNKSRNPVPGQFDYKVELDSPWTQTIVEFPVTLPLDPESDGYFVAAHGAACYLGGVEGFNFYLPNNTVQLVAQNYPAPGSTAYWKFKLNNAGFISTYDSDGDGGPLQAGEYLGWCIDVDHNISPGATYNSQLFSSYETLPAWLIGPGMLEHPENLDEVNYLINTFNTGQVIIHKTASCNIIYNTETQEPVQSDITYGDIQRAIWILLDDGFGTNGPYNQDRVNAILCDVDANGHNFIPKCNQKIVFIVVPNIGDKISYQLIIGQPVIGEVQVPCDTQCETAWGDGKIGANFPGAKQWGTYFRWDETWCPAP
jgi:hypothetical protein